MRKLLIAIIAGLITLVPANSYASPYYSENEYSFEYELESYWLSSWILDWTTFISEWVYVEEEPVQQVNAFFYPRAEISDVTHGFAPRSEAIIPPGTSSETVCSTSCSGTVGSVGYSPGEVGYNDGIRIITRDPSNGAVYERLNFEHVSSSWVSMGCDSNAVAACFIK